MCLQSFLDCHPTNGPVNFYGDLPMAMSARAAWLRDARIRPMPRRELCWGMFICRERIVWRSRENAILRSENQPMYRHPTCPALFACWFLFLGGCGSRDSVTSQPSDAEKAGQTAVVRTQVTLALNWFPEAEHGGYYAAQVQGFFAEENLDVKILPGGPGAPVIQLLTAQRATFVVGNADQVLTGRNEEADVVALMAPLQMSPRCIMVHEKSGIQSLEELQGITLAMSAGRAFALYMQKKLPLKDVRIVGYPGNVTNFLQDPNFAQQGYVFSEPFVAREKGGDPHTLMVSDLGFNPYTSLLLTNGATLREQRELVEKMTRASVRGWQSYLENPGPVNDHIHGLNEEMGRGILDYGAEILKDLCLPEGMPKEELGRMTQRRWQELAVQLVEIDLISNELDVDAAFDTTLVTGERAAP